jgi:hypothetical protein
MQVFLPVLLQNHILFDLQSKFFLKVCIYYLLLFKNSFGNAVSLFDSVQPVTSRWLLSCEKYPQK